MARSYNFIYEIIVENEDDIVGHIAYSLYKTDKIDWVKNFKESNKKDPDEKDIEKFHNIVSTTKSIERYRMTADHILINFLGLALDENITDIEKSIRDNYQQSIKDVIKPISPPRKWISFFSSVASSFVGAIFFAGFGLYFVLLGRYDLLGIPLKKEKCTNTQIKEYKKSSNDTICNKKTYNSRIFLKVKKQNTNTTKL